MEMFLSDQEFHEFTQWFSFHYKDSESDYPKEDIFNLVDNYIKGDKPRVGFIRWFTEEYEIYGDCSGRGYTRYIEDDSIVGLRANYIETETTRDWLDEHFRGGHVQEGLIYTFFQAKMNGDLFKIVTKKELLAFLNGKNIKLIN